MIKTEIIWESPMLQDPQKIFEEMARAALESAEDAGKETDDAMENGAKSGAKNPRTGKNRSARFEPPAKDKGTLLESKSVTPTGRTEATLAYDAPHAPRRF